MLKSMTGYGRSKLQLDGKEYTIEIKSVNHRFVDITVKTPRGISYLEDKIKKTVLNSVNRGKIDIYVSYTNIGTTSECFNINKELANKYVAQLKEIALENNLLSEINVADILRFPDILITEGNNVDEDEVWNVFEEKLKEAITTFDNMRINEGAKLCEDILHRVGNISKNLDIISKESTGLVEKYIVKLNTRIKEILKTDIIDENRLAQEAVIFSDKCSIEEEITRLKSHIEQFTNMVNESTAKGKKIDFLLQEMNRETNTIASKANCLEITKMVVEIKTELENIREQIQNIE